MQSMQQVNARLATIERELASLQAAHGNVIDLQNDTGTYITRRLLSLGVRIGRVITQVEAAESTDVLGSGTVKLTHLLDPYNTDDLEIVVFNISAKIYTVGTLVAILTVGDNFFICSDPGVFANQTLSLFLPPLLRVSVAGNILFGQFTDSAATPSVLTITAISSLSPIHTNITVGASGVTVLSGNNTALCVFSGTAAQLNLLFAMNGWTMSDAFALVADAASVKISVDASDGRTLSTTLPLLLSNGYGFSNDTTLVNDSAISAVSEHAVKTYVDAQPKVVTQILSTAGVFAYAKPANAKLVVMTACGGAGGGGSGRKGSTSTARGGGGGGGGASVQVSIYLASLFNNNDVVTVGAGGAGGVAVSANDTNGNDGVNGTNTSVVGTGVGGVTFNAIGGSKGVGGSTAGGTGGAAGFVLPANMTQGDGGAGGAAGAAVAGGNTTVSAGFACNGGGGGGGGGITSGNVATAAAAGGSSVSTFTAGGAAGATTPTVGGVGTSSGNSLWAGAGGGGGGSNATATTGARTGGNGGSPGGGGGGGGASLNTANSGAGGKGGDGFILIQTYC